MLAQARGKAVSTGKAKVAAFARAMKKQAMRSKGGRRPIRDNSWSVLPRRGHSISGAIELPSAVPLLNLNAEVVVAPPELTVFDRNAYRVDFEDAQKSFKSKSSLELARSLIIFKVIPCRILLEGLLPVCDIHAQHAHVWWCLRQC